MQRKALQEKQELAPKPRPKKPVEEAPTCKPIEDDAKHFSQSLLAWFGKNRSTHPWRQLFADTRDPYVIWVSEIMLQQTTIKAVLPKYIAFLQRFPDVLSLAEATEAEIKQAVQGLGYYRRFRFMHEAARHIALASKSAVHWPKSHAEWLALPGIGPYTAAAISSIVLNAPYAVLDGNVKRVLARIAGRKEALSDSALLRDLECLSAELLDEQRPGAFNEAIMELGQKICTVSEPLCGGCPQSSFCRAFSQKIIAECPGKQEPKVYEDVSLRLLILEKDGAIGVLERPRSARFLKGTDGFMTFRLQGTETQHDGEPQFDSHFVGAKTLGSFSHSITKYRIKADVCWKRLRNIPRGLERLKWVEKANALPFFVSSLDLKAMRIFLTQR